MEPGGGAVWGVGDGDGGRDAGWGGREAEGGGAESAGPAGPASDLGRQRQRPAPAARPAGPRPPPRAPDCSTMSSRGVPSAKVMWWITGMSTCGGGGGWQGVGEVVMGHRLVESGAERCKASSVTAGQGAPACTPPLRLPRPSLSSATTRPHLLLLQLLEHAARGVHAADAGRRLEQRQRRAHALERAQVLRALRAVDEHR